MIAGGLWKRLSIEYRNGREILQIRARRSLRRHGKTQLTWESAAPTFDELTPAGFLARFPEIVYEIEAVSVDGEGPKRDVEVIHAMAAPVPNLTLNGQPAVTGVRSAWFY